MIAARALRWVADQLDPPTFGPESTAYNMKLVAAAQRSVFDEDGANERRVEHTLRMIDPQTLGYLLLMIREDDDVHIEPHAVMRDEAWPAMGDVLARLCVEADRMRVGQ